MKRIVLAIMMAIIGLGVSLRMQAQDDGQFPDFYLKGTFTDPQWNSLQYKFERSGNTYSIHMDRLNGEFKISDRDWNKEYGSTGGNALITQPVNVEGVKEGPNFIADNLEDVTIRFTYNSQDDRHTVITFIIKGVSPGGDGPVVDPVVSGLSGTLPVLYINVYDENGNLNNEINSKDLAHKNYFTGEYWLDLNGVNWMDGAVSVGSREEPLPLEIKARGNYTRTGFSKKPFKLKLGKKQSLLGLTKSKHFAILAHADDIYGYMRNFTGFNLGKRIGLPWTPDQQPVEVVINGDYRGLYFLTESIRVEEDRVNIAELEDNVSDPALASGGYLVELDNYDEDENQIRMEEKGTVWDGYRDLLRITFDTPEIYSDLQRRFITDQFTAMNNAVGENSDNLWRYMDIDDAARYYIVEEIISHTEAYHGSTYLFRDRGEGQKWHFSPLWDCGNAFNGSDNDYFTKDGTWGNTWIASLRQNQKFMNKVRETWKWFMSQKYNGIEEDLDRYSNSLKAAAQADYKRWNNQPTPNSDNSQAVVDNRDMDYKLSQVKGKLRNKTNWLRQQWGDFNGNYGEPTRDNTEAAPLPEYLGGNEDPEEPVDPNAPVFYVRGTSNGWSDNSLQMTRTGNTYSIHLDRLDGEFKITTDDWKNNYGAEMGSDPTVSGPVYKTGVLNGDNFQASNLTNVEISFVYSSSNPYPAKIKFTVNGVAPSGEDDPIIDPVDSRLSGTLPVLYINVYDENGNLNNEINSKDLDHKNYFTGEYWLDLNGVDWMEGASSLGSKEEPLPLEIKARGNWTRKGFSKKPFKLKLGKKQAMLGMTKSKHFAILAHADDVYGYMRNFTGFNLGKRIGLPWTPDQQPVEVIINGDYRGLYFLTESIRVEEERVNITELDDNVSDPALVSGGYLVELDNYDEDESSQIRMEEKGTVWDGYKDMLRITFDTPEVYSDIQRKFIFDQFTAMNDAVGANSDNLWRYMDLDDAARYYIVEEIISHTEAYHGSTYLFRDYGEGQKWHFSPLWDCGNAFNGSDNNYFTKDGTWGNTWIASLRQNQKFMNKVRETWKWFMSQKYDGIESDLDRYSNSLKAAAQADYKRWDGQPTPNEGQGVVDNRNMDDKLNQVKGKLRNKTNWLRQQWGDFNNGFFAEPARDTTEAAPLPTYITTGVGEIEAAIADGEEPEIYNLQGMRVSTLTPGEVYIIRYNGDTKKVMGR